MTVTVDFQEGERQAVVHALASLAAERPGWKPYLRQIAERMDPGGVLFDAMHSTRDYPRRVTDQTRPLLSEEWDEIGKRCSAGRRSLWMRLVFKTGLERDHRSFIRQEDIEAIELRAGREGDDAYVKIVPSQPQFAELLDLLLTARYGAST